MGIFFWFLVLASGKLGQIRDRRYALRFKGKLGEKSRYTGRILAVGISYDRRTKEHFCKVEEIKACEGGL